MLQTIKASGLKLNQAKCRLRQTELKFFGHIISPDGVKPDSSKVEAITKMAVPTNVEQLRQVLGLVNYLGKFLPGLSTILHPIRSLLRKRLCGFGMEHRNRHSAERKLRLQQRQHGATTTQDGQQWSVRTRAAMAWALPCCRTTLGNCELLPSALEPSQMQRKDTPRSRRSV